MSECQCGLLLLFEIASDPLEYSRELYRALQRDLNGFTEGSTGLYRALHMALQGFTEGSAGIYRGVCRLKRGLFVHSPVSDSSLSP